MMNELFKSIIIKGLRIRKENGEDIEDVVARYSNLTEEEKQEILSIVND